MAAGAGSGFNLARYNSDLPTLTIDPQSRLGAPFTATFSGTSLNDGTYYDVRFRRSRAGTDQVALNWQRSLSAVHIVPTNIATGTWTITGVHPHQNPDDHTAFIPVSVELRVVP